jgi:hypothetical protein
MGFQLVCCWPGLAALWCGGKGRSLAAALIFTWAICILLLATFVWPGWFSVWVVRVFWLVAGCVWLANCVWSHLSFSTLVGLPDSKAHAVFEEAQAQYLQGNWFDAEALLLLIGVLRHTQRWQPALRRLDQLQSLDTAAGWHFEIIRERQIVEKRFREAILEPQTAD